VPPLDRGTARAESVGLAAASPWCGYVLAAKPPPRRVVDFEFTSVQVETDSKTVLCRKKSDELRSIVPRFTAPLQRRRH
jgi:hypothetical protein